MQHLPADSSLQEDFSARYWRCLYEFKRRRFAMAHRRLCEKILDLSIGEGFPDVEIPSIEWLAEATFCTPNNLHPVIAKLCEANVLGRETRLKTWWINDIDLWKRLACDEDIADPHRAQRAATATARILRHNKLRSSQGQMFPLPTTDAEVAADGLQAHATDWSVTGLPSAVTAPPSLSAMQQEGEGLKIRLESLKFRLQKSEKKTEGSENKTVLPPALVDTRAGARPGYQEIQNQEILGKPGEGQRTPSRWQLDAAGWSLWRDLEAFCVGGGDAPFTADHARQWQWRIWKSPHLVELCLRETMAHVREGRRPIIRSRAGWMKHLWSQEEKQEAAPRSPEDVALAQRARAELEKHLGTGGKAA